MEGGPGSGLSQELGCRAHEKLAACGAGDRGPEVTGPGCCWLQGRRGIGAWCWGPAREPGFLPHGAVEEKARPLAGCPGTADKGEGGQRGGGSEELPRGPGKAWAANESIIITNATQTSADAAQAGAPFKLPPSNCPPSVLGPYQC